MGTTAQKLEYLGTTKSQLKDMINYGLPTEEQITSNTTFRNYVSSIFDAFLEALRTPDTLFTNLPKKSGSGSNITLNNTAYAPMRIELGATELTQDGTPTPSSPQDIHTISGSNTIKVEGKNLFDAQNVVYVNSKILNDSGAEISDASGGYTKMYIPITPNTTYTISGFGSTGRKRIYYFDKNKAFISRDSGTTSSSYTFTIPNNCYFIDIQYYYSGTNDFQNWQLELGSTATTYEAFNGTDYSVDLGDIEYCKIGTYEDRIFKNISTDEDYDNTKVEGGWYIKKNINKIVLDENSNVVKYDNEGRYYINGIEGKKGSSGSPNAMSNYFYGTWSTSNGSIFISGVDGTINMINTSYLNDLAGFKTWLGTTTPTIYYIMATPTYTQITGTLAEQLENVYKNMLSQEGQTNISQVNNDLSFNMSVLAIEE